MARLPLREVSRSGDVSELSGLMSLKSTLSLLDEAGGWPTEHPDSELDDSSSLLGRGTVFHRWGVFRYSMFEATLTNPFFHDRYSLSRRPRFLSWF